MKICNTCGGKLWRGNKTGYCARHVTAALRKDPAYREKHLEGVRRANADPVISERIRENGRVVAKRIGLDKIGREVLRKNPEYAKEAGRSSSRKRLKDIPPEQMATYMELTKVKRVKAAEARKMVMEKQESDMKRWRREMQEAHVAASNRHRKEWFGG